MIDSPWKVIPIWVFSYTAAESVTWDILGEEDYQKP